MRCRGVRAIRSTILGEMLRGGKALSVKGPYNNDTIDTLFIKMSVF